MAQDLQTTTRLDVTVPQRSPVREDQARGSGGDVPPERPSSEIDPEVEYESADLFEWDESADVPARADGIGSLSLQSAGAGYMGPQSGNAILRKLQHIRGSPLPEEYVPIEASAQVAVPEETLKSTWFMNDCVDNYFKYYHPAYPILHEGTFRAQYFGALPKPNDGSWPILENIVRSIGAFSSSFCLQNADYYYYQQASSQLSWSILRKGSISLVQTLCLLANYLQKRDRPNTGFTLLGVAMNMALGLGLHREFSASSISPRDMEIRRRVWWTLYIFDSGARVTFGRATITINGVTVRQPHNLDDKDLAVDLARLPPNENRATVASSLIWQLKLARIGNLANEELCRSGQPNANSMLDFGQQIDDWSDELPAYMRESTPRPEHDPFEVPRMVLLWRSMHLRIIIFRPFLLEIVKDRRPLDLTESGTPHSKCLAAASECVLSINIFWGSTHAHRGSLAWYAFYWLVTATFVHITCLLYDPVHLEALEWRQMIQLSREALGSLGDYERLATRATTIMDQLLGLVPSNPDSTFFDANQLERLEFAEFWNHPWANTALFFENGS
ncbi:Cutinase transcription factor 1 alpha [Elsinoe australis]|uniref:Cutinase transcription factor 1 alpha n=1 Tax=Elsinoe australis TaxID=40998 RepID=A0A2P7ZZZ7_9PEZI|nr:Cutinase transcription factor 1 alpha [Elsinoe australis]